MITGPTGLLSGCVAVCAMPGVAATEESSASRPNGVAFERSQCGAAQVDASERARVKIGAKRLSFAKFDTMIAPTANAKPSTRWPRQSAFAPMRQINPDLPALRDTPPDACVQTMTGSRFPGSRVVAFNHLPRID
jgi:hypothetical protein